jgi:hypothetical protein
MAGLVFVSGVHNYTVPVPRLRLYWATGHPWMLRQMRLWFSHSVGDSFRQANIPFHLPVARDRRMIGMES